MSERNFFARVGTPRCGVRGALFTREMRERHRALRRYSDGAARRPYLSIR